jgi:hypothetical protein
MRYVRNGDGVAVWSMSCIFAIKLERLNGLSEHRSLLKSCNWEAVPSILVSSDSPIRFVLAPKILDSLQSMIQSDPMNPMNTKIENTGRYKQFWITGEPGVGRAHRHGATQFR